MQVPIASVGIMVMFLILGLFTVASRALSHGRLYKREAPTQRNAKRSQMHTQKSKQVFSCSSVWICFALNFEREQSTETNTLH